MNEQLLDNNLGDAVELRPNAERANQLVIILAVAFIVNLISGVSSYMQLQLLNDFLAGRTPSDIEIDSNDNREIIVAVTTIILRIITVVLFIRWFRRAYFNTGLRENTQFSEGWAAGSWFVPFLNLFRPYQIMKEIWSSSAKNSSIPESESIIGIWWFFWVTSIILGNIANRLSRNAVEVDSLISSTYLDMAVIAVTIPLTIVTIIMIKKHNKMEEETGF